MFAKVNIRIPKVSRLVVSPRPTKSRISSSIFVKESTNKIHVNKPLIGYNVRFFADAQAKPVPPPTETKTTTNNDSQSNNNKKQEEQKQKQNESQKKETVAQKELPKTMDFREFKKLLNSKAPRYMGLWYILAPVLLAIASMYYYNETDKEERKVDKALKMIRSVDVETRKAGLDALEDCLYLREHLIATVTDVPQSFDLLLKEGCLDALLQSIREGDTETKQKSLVWLVRMSSVPEARKYISQHFADALVPIISNGDGSALWVTAAALLSRLTSYADSAHSVASPQLVQLLEKNLDGSHHPIASLMSAHVLSTLLQRQENLNLSIGTNQLDALTNNRSAKAAISAILKNAVPSTSENQQTWKYLDQLRFAALFGIFGWAYGRFRWSRKIKREASRNNLAVERERLVKYISKRSKVGRYVFFLLSLDVLTELAMSWPSSGVSIHSPLLTDKPVHLQLPENLYGLPKSTYLPIGEAGLFSLTALWAIRRQRYVVLPLLTASYVAHEDAIRHLTGGDVSDVFNTVSTFVHENADKLLK